MPRSTMPPRLSDEQRREALAKAAIARRRRADLKQALKSGETTLDDLLTATDDEVVAKMKVSMILEALPGVGPARARKVMERLQIAASRRVRGLGIKQIDSLRKEFEAR